MTWYSENREYALMLGKRYRENNKEKVKEIMKNYRLKNKEKLDIQREKYYLLHPWVRTLNRIKSRIKHSKSYKNRTCLLTTKELKELYFRDKAYLLKRPSIDRINNNKGYFFSNCRYIELSENISKFNKEVI